MRKSSGLLDFRLNLILIGDSGVGKTSLLNKYTKGIFLHQINSSIGFDYFSKLEEINNNHIKIKLWDTAGQEQYRSLTKNFYRNAEGIIIVFDVSNKKSFENVKDWMQSIKEFTTKDIHVSLVGNKIDLEIREVLFEEASNLSKLLNIDYFECSAKDNIGFQKCVKTLSYNILTNQKREDGSKIDILLKNDKKHYCC